ncbi:MAG: activator of HSP90 ATPase [Saprospiraceae bacterium]|nr:activator of HSP90 ATPase [Saprospiraceae bacterium]
MPEFISITVGTQINSNIEKVWRCWTEPQHIVNWNFADVSWCCLNASNNLEVGGSFSYRMEAKDGSFGFDFTGIYDEIVHHRKLKYHLSDERKVSIEFSDTDNGIQVQEVFDAETENPIEMQQAGWQLILDNFKKYVEGLQ